RSGQQADDHARRGPRESQNAGELLAGFGPRLNVRGASRMKIGDLLARIVKDGASDGFVAADAPPSVKVDGQIFPVAERPLSEEEARHLVLSSMNENQKREFIERNECNYAIATENLGRFRASAFVQR